MGKGNKKEAYADWSEEEKTVHRLRDGLRELVAEGSFGAGALKAVALRRRVRFAPVTGRQVRGTMPRI